MTYLFELYIVDLKGNEAALVVDSKGKVNFEDQHYFLRHTDTIKTYPSYDSLVSLHEPRTFMEVEIPLNRVSNNYLEYIYNNHNPQSVDKITHLANPLELLTCEKNTYFLKSESGLKMRIQDFSLSDINTSLIQIRKFLAYNDTEYPRHRHE